MSPKVQYTKEELIEAAFDIAAENGVDAITVRAVAAKLGCSVAPIYVNFATSADLITAVLKRTEELTFEYMQRDYSKSPFLNMGIGEITFAKEYGRLFRDVVVKRSAYVAKKRADYTRYLALMKRDPHTHGLSEIELLDILIKMDVFTQGLALIASDEKNQMEISQERIVEMLEETGADLIVGATLRRKGEHPYENGNR